MRHAQRNILRCEISGSGGKCQYPRSRTCADLAHIIREGEGFILVYSITARSTFERIERFRTQIARVKDSDTVPIVLVGNKVDKATEREVSREEGQALAKRMGCDFIEASAKTRVNLEYPYFSLVRQSESCFTAVFSQNDCLTCDQ